MSVDDVGDLFHENKSEIEQWIQHGLSVDPDDLSEDMEAAKHSLWLDPLRCSAFFADFVLLVEGPTERALIPRMFADGSIPLARSGVFVMDCLGKYNIHRFMNLFSKLRISHSVLFDLDNGKQPYIESTIESSRTDKTYAIRTFPVDIETFLGIPRAGSPHRKPQHVMFCYRNGKIEDKKLRELASIIQSLVP
jgi:predicted ATP-dependent endonuclease of OLD family